MRINTFLTYLGVKIHADTRHSFLVIMARVLVEK